MLLELHLEIIAVPKIIYVMSSAISYNMHSFAYDIYVSDQISLSFSEELEDWLDLFVCVEFQLFPLHWFKRLCLCHSGAWFIVKDQLTKLGW